MVVDRQPPSRVYYTTTFLHMNETGVIKVGVVAFLLSACQKLHSHEQKCCQALSGVVYVETEPPICIVPRILFLDNYFYCKDKSNWDWPSGPRMHTMGPLTLRSVFKFKYT
ncbi:pumilio homolog 23 [Tanacetum coccineum]